MTISNDIGLRKCNFLFFKMSVFFNISEIRNFKSTIVLDD